nr:hypothetical protein Itr_chr10CG06020 [Ipomoea trifida]
MSGEGGQALPESADAFVFDDGGAAVGDPLGGMVGFPPFCFSSAIEQEGFAKPSEGGEGEGVDTVRVRRLRPSPLLLC